MKNLLWTLIQLSMAFALMNAHLAADWHTAARVVCDKFADVVISNVSRDPDYITNNVSPHATIACNGRSMSRTDFMVAACSGTYKTRAPMPSQELHTRGHLHYINWKAAGYNVAVSFNKETRLIDAVTLVITRDY
ncbi:uncharacterized protein MELLADRAFT_124562 [Melampsora larici-populina 98AG31]|uniref:Secreted protein n=1 Tax=Melampsora larici-populina (strain 98AG31 / pathotype 3-4-7) TaxID=747676 RepID=F4S2Q7_MELLP|nr:uncharacterized protein MELLADRAFT_124561 [Melampsora larici-populina 98AG31]XP_007415642.1 uncharacterized protein MELLADRAFT_124562 [Melampsora larici-populina 98AG31]EGG01041.1 secreted protein [Melampsora larici-populina 98AG31]EGG01042.1 secreted protein [Melampsora larici-populina 98AG31]